MHLVSIGQAALLLGVAVITLRHWEVTGRLSPAGRTPGNHRRYDLASLKQMLGLAPPMRTTVAYARVSSHDQKEQLGWQAERLQRHCAEQGYTAEIITDLGSGMNTQKKGLQRLLRLVIGGQCERLVLVTRDRLLRFGADLVFTLCALRGVKVEILDTAPAASQEQQLASDLVEIITVFSSRLYGSRSRKNLKALAAIN